MLPKKPSKQICIVLRVAESNTATCKVQDIVEFMVSVTPAGCHLHKSRQEAARAHPLRETQVIEKYLSPHTLLQPCLKLLLLRKAVLSSYSLPSGALGQQSSHWSGLLLLLFLLMFLLQSQTRIPVLLLALDNTQEAGTAFATSKGFKTSSI